MTIFDDTASFAHDFIVSRIISHEVELFLLTEDQDKYLSADVEAVLLDQINNRLLSENKKYCPVKALPPTAIAECILNRELKYACAIGQSRETAEQLMIYVDGDLDNVMYVSADRHIRRIANQYRYKMSYTNLCSVVEHVRDWLPLLSETRLSKKPSAGTDILAS